MAAMELGLKADERGSVGAPQWNTNSTQNQAALPRKGTGREVSTTGFDHRSLTLSPQERDISSPDGPGSRSDDGEKIACPVTLVRVVHSLCWFIDEGHVRGICVRRMERSWCIGDLDEG